MSDIQPADAPVPVEAAPEPPPPPPAPREEPRRRRGPWPVLAALLFVLLFAAVGWLWLQQQQQQQAGGGAAVTAELAALQDRVAALDRQVAGLSSRPAPAPAAAVDLRPLEARVAALEQRPAQPAPAPPQDLSPLAQKLDSVAADAAAAKGQEADLGGRLAALEQRLSTAEQQADQLGAKAAVAQRIAQAQVALEGGAPLGSIPGAPPALARFAEQSPPTEAALRLTFPDAAAAAEQASRPSVAGKSFGERMWLRARALITVKQGDRVVVGAPAAEVLGQARARLDAGDLAGAVAALDGLDGPAAQAMAGWRAQAQSLLDARAALAQMARG